MDQEKYEKLDFWAKKAINGDIYIKNIEYQYIYIIIYIYNIIEQYIYNGDVMVTYNHDIGMGPRLY